MTERRIDGPVILVQTATDPGDIGEPRSIWDDEEKAEVVFVPSFDLWPSERQAGLDVPTIEELRHALAMALPGYQWSDIHLERVLADLRRAARSRSATAPVTEEKE